MLANVYLGIGINLMDQGLLKEAIDYFKQSKRIAREIGAKKELRSTYEQLIQAYAYLKDFEKSKAYIDAYEAIDNSMQLTIIEKKLEQLENPKDKNFLTYHTVVYLLFSILFFILVVIIVFRTKR